MSNGTTADPAGVQAFGEKMMRGYTPDAAMQWVSDNTAGCDTQQLPAATSAANPLIMDAFIVAAAARIAELEAALRSIADAQPHHTGQTPNEYHFQRRAREALTPSNPAPQPKAAVDNDIKVYLKRMDDALLARDGSAELSHDEAKKALRDVYLLSCGKDPEFHPERHVSEVKS